MITIPILAVFVGALAAAVGVAVVGYALAANREPATSRRNELRETRDMCAVAALFLTVITAALITLALLGWKP